MPDRSRTLLLLCVTLLAGGCGYRLSTGQPRGPLATVKSLAILPLDNDTLGFRIEQSLTNAVHQAFVARSPYRVQSVPEGADAVLRGSVTSFYSSPVAFDPRSGRTTEVLLTVGLRVELTDSRSGQTLFESGDWIYREPYEVSQDPAVYFGENQPAVDRLSRRMADSLLTMIMEGVE
jgi:outer membrane lipopolysaccharide assembly protein LptE/RlpB